MVTDIIGVAKDVIGWAGGLLAAGGGGALVALGIFKFLG